MIIDFFVENVSNLEKIRSYLTQEFTLETIIKGDDLTELDDNFIFINYENQKGNFPFFLTISNIPIRESKEVLQLGLKLSDILNSEVIIIDDLFNCFNDHEVAFVIIKRNKQILIGRNKDLIKDSIEYDVVGRYLNGKLLML